MRNPLDNDEDLESFLHKRVADHRMYPSDQLWRNIQKELHGEGRWPALTYISIFIITALSVCTLMVKPEERLHKNSIVYPAVKEETAAIAEKIVGKNRSGAGAAAVQYGYAERMTQQTMQTVNEVLVARVETEKAPQPVNLTHESLLTVASNATEGQVAATLPSVTKTTAIVKPAEPMQTNVVSHTTEENKVSATSAPSLQFAAARPASRYFSTIGLMKLSDLKKPGEQASSLLYDNDEIWRKFPLTNASDLWRKKLSKFSFQFYITPSVSYRRLTDAHGKTALSYTALPRANNYQLDINHVVEHQAQMGAEVGFAMGYKLTNTLTAKGGLQFNLRQYGIKAYTIPVPQNPADAATDNAPAITTTNPDEIAVENNTYLTSANNNTDVSKPVVLSNRYYELSVPIGLDWRILSSGNGRLTVNAAASLQPTYTFDKEPFVITTDYKNYTEGASIMRNWNLNSSAEAYISYQIGPFRWQLGPQFRYQHFSTYSNTYPIREHLLDYGVKIGFTKSLD